MTILFKNRVDEFNAYEEVKDRVNPLYNSRLASKNNDLILLLKGGVHISAHVHESKCFFLFLINFMALKIPLTGTSVIIFYNWSKQND